MDTINNIPITSRTQPYKAWKQMKWACKTNNKAFKKDFKDKGISYEANFDSFDKFWSVMKHGWVQGARLCRKNPNRWFTEFNCYWKLPNNKPPYKKAKCASGVWGLKKVTDKNGYDWWVVRLSDKTKRRVSKFFSVHRLGDVYGFMCAVNYLRTVKSQ